MILRAALEETIDGKVLGQPNVSSLRGGRGADGWVMLLDRGLQGKHRRTLLLMLLQGWHQDCMLVMLLLNGHHRDMLMLMLLMLMLMLMLVLMLMLLMMLLLKSMHAGALLMQRQTVRHLLLLLKRRHVVVLLIQRWGGTSLRVAHALLHGELRLGGVGRAAVR
jgi:hypothetical protein